MARHGRYSAQKNARDGGSVSQRQLRVGELIRHALSEVLQREDFSREEIRLPPITVSEVRMTADLKRATCFVMPLGGGDAGAVVKDLAYLAPQLSKLIGPRLLLKFTPRLLFRADMSFDEAQRIASVLGAPKVKADLVDRRGDAGDADSQG